MDSEVRPSSAHGNDSSEVLLPFDAEELPIFEVVEICSSDEAMMLNDEIVDVQRLEDGDAERLPNDEVVVRGGSDDAGFPYSVVSELRNPHDARLPDDDVGFPEHEIINITSSGDDEIASRSTRPRGRGGTRPNALLGLLRPHLSASSLLSHSSYDITSQNSSIVPYSASSVSSHSSDESEISLNSNFGGYSASSFSSHSSDNSRTSQNGNIVPDHNTRTNNELFPSLLGSVEQIWERIQIQVLRVSVIGLHQGLNPRLYDYMQRRAFAERQYNQFYRIPGNANMTLDVPNVLCTICTEQDASLDWMMLPCGHIYCTLCIGQLFRRSDVNQRCPVCQCSLRLHAVTRLGVRPGPGQHIVPTGGIPTQTLNDGSDPGQNVVPTGGITTQTVNDGTVENPLDLTGNNSSH